MATYIYQDIHVALHCCQGWQVAADLFAIVTEVLRVGDCIPLENRLVAVGERKQARPIVQDRATWLRENYRYAPAWDAQAWTTMMPKESLSVTMRTTLDPAWRVPEPLWGGVEVDFAAAAYGPAYNIIGLYAGLEGPRLANQGRSELAWTTPMLHLFRTLMRALLPIAQPAYACLGDGQLDSLDARAIIHSDLPGIYWCNYYGPAYLARYGEPFLRTAPGWCSEPLAGGLWYQPTEHYADLADPTLREQIWTHFHPVGVTGIAGMARHRP